MNKAGFTALAAVAITIIFLPSFAYRVAFLLASAGAAAWVASLPAPIEPEGWRAKRGVLHERFRMDKVPGDLDTIVIGSGMGGLTCAATLARMGKKVLVLEQHTVAGGSTHSFEFQGYRFDSGLHYTVPWSGPLFQLTCLKKPDEVPQFTLMGTNEGTFDKIYLGDHKQSFDIKHGEKHLDTLYKMFPEEKAAIDEYIRITNYALASVKVFVFSKLLPLWLQPLFWKLVPSSYKRYTRETAVEVLGRITKNQELISILCGLWIDTGCRPDLATFMLTASVFRGLPLEGGCYPTGGPESMAEALLPPILAAGGKVLCRARVEKILTSGGRRPRAIGVQLSSGEVIHATHVVSAVGYLNTAGKLLDQTDAKKAGLPQTLPGISSSSGFVMANIGIRGSANELKLDNINVWYHPTGGKKDIMPALQKYYQNPLESDAPAMITFPSIKAGNRNDPKTSCQMLFMAEWSWFEKFSSLSEKERETNMEYQALKRRWLDKALEILFRFYPQIKGKVEFADLSTPLSINHYIEAPHGGAVGLDHTPPRYCDWEVQKHLDVSTPIPNLYMTGQDQIICGVVLAQLCGVITAFRMSGFMPSLRIVLQSIFLI